MAYVDLNPIRAGLAESLDTSNFTAVQARINTVQGQTPTLPLIPFEDQPEPAKNPLPYYLRHYLELVDWTGRAVRDNKMGEIPENLEAILERLGFDESSWLAGIMLFGKPMFQAIGSADRMRQAAHTNHRAWYRGVTSCQSVFGPP